MWGTASVHQHCVGGLLLHFYGNDRRRPHRIAATNGTRDTIEGGACCHTEQPGYIRQSTAHGIRDVARQISASSSTYVNELSPLLTNGNSP